MRRVLCVVLHHLDFILWDRQPGLTAILSRVTWSTFCGGIIAELA